MVTKLLLSLLSIILCCLMAGCNKRIYIGMDDYGQTDTHEVNWTTKGKANFARK